MEPFSRVWEGREVRAALVAFPGIGGHSGDFTAWGEEISARGAALAARDYPGFGARWEEPTGDPRAGAIEVDAALQAARSRWPGRPVVALGESLGALIVLSQAASGRSRADGLVLCSPAIRTPGKITPAGMAVLAFRLAVRSRKPFDYSGSPSLLTVDPVGSDEIARDPARRRELRAGYLYSAWRLQLTALKLSRAVTVPSLILWGEGDQIASFPACRRLLGTIPAPLRRIEVIPGERHMLSRGLRRRQTAELIWRWIDETLVRPAGGEASMAG